MIGKDGLESWFCDVEYNIKTASEIRTAMDTKNVELVANIQVRETRIVALCEQFEISSERLASLVLEYRNRDSDTMVSFEAQTRADGETLVPAGVIANIVQERSMVESEKAQITKLKLVQRNLCDTEQFPVSGTGEIKTRPCIHKLDDEELIYLGF